jgi:hypothetical protein
VSGVIIAALLLGRGKQSTMQSNYQQPMQPTYMNIRPPTYRFSTLEEISTTPELKNMLERIKQETVPQVKDIWIDHLIEKATCPNCQHPLKHFNRKIWCDHCDFKTTY